MSQTVHTLTGSFTARGDGIVMTEGTFPGVGQGRYIVDALSLQPPATQVWTLLGWSVQFHRFLALNNGVGTGQHQGVMGDVFAGLTDQSRTAPSNGVGIPGVAMPNDDSRIAKIWDGATGRFYIFDAAVIPRGFTEKALATSESFTFALPQPIELDIGQQLAMGLWMRPNFSMHGNDFPGVAFARWSLTYSIAPVNPGGYRVLT